MSKTLYLIKHDGQGMGGFLCPPGHPNHFYSVHGYSGGRVKPVSGPDIMAGLDLLIQDEYGDVPPAIKADAKLIMDDAKLKCSELWLRSVYGYFRNSYSPDGVNRNVSDAISTGKFYCQCGQEFWGATGLDYHLEHGPITGGPHYEAAKPLPPAEHHLGYLCVREYFPDHEIRLDLIDGPSGYGAHKCPKCDQQVQYEARLDSFAAVHPGSPWRYIADCPEGGTHE